jgi:hypothetical protein
VYLHFGITCYNHLQDRTLSHARNCLLFSLLLDLCQCSAHTASPTSPRPYMETTSRIGSLTTLGPPLSSRIALIITYAANSFSMKMEIAGLSDKSVNLYTRLYYISRCSATIIVVVMSCVPTHHSANRIEPIYSSV